MLFLKNSFRKNSTCEDVAGRLAFIFPAIRMCLGRKTQVIFMYEYKIKILGQGRTYHNGSRCLTTSTDTNNYSTTTVTSKVERSSSLSKGEPCLTCSSLEPDVKQTRLTFGSAF